MPKTSRSADRLPSSSPPLLFSATPALLKMPRRETTHRVSSSRSPAQRSAAAVPAPFPEPIEPLLDVKRAAPLLGISVKTLRDWILYRRIDHVKVGSRVMIRPETIRSLVARNTRPAENSHEHLEARR